MAAVPPFQVLQRRFAQWSPMARRPVAADQYRATHRSLLVDVAQRGITSPVLPLGGILLPTSRSLTQQVPGLQLGAELARRQGCPLIVAHSKRARAADVPAHIRRALGSQLVTIGADAHRAWAPQLASSKLRLGRLHRHNDAAAKRNLGLSLAAAMGWTSLLLLDDDISPSVEMPTLDDAGLRRALTALEGSPNLRLVGWSAEGMQDHSVVGHSRRLAGMPQDTFIGAGALLIKCDEQTSFFPNIYNDDWLFTIDSAGRAGRPGEAIGWAGSVRQLPYNPFVAERARAEEPGEVLAECLMNLLEDRVAGCRTSPRKPFWKDALANRAALIHALHDALGIQARLQPAAMQSVMWQAQRALRVSRRANDDLSAPDLENYVVAWSRDVALWRDHLSSLRTRGNGRPDPAEVIAQVQAGVPRTGVIGDGLVDVDERTLLPA